MSNSFFDDISKRANERRTNSWAMQKANDRVRSKDSICCE